MRIPLSHRQTILYKVVQFIFMFCLCCVALGCMGELRGRGEINLLILYLSNLFIFAFFIFLYRVLAGRLYRMMYDDTTLHYTRFFITRHLPITEIKSMRMGKYRHRVATFAAFPIIIETKKGKTIRCLAPPAMSKTAEREPEEYMILLRRVNGVDERTGQRPL